MEPTADTNRLFSPSGCLEKEALQAYLRHETRPEETRAIELHLAECPLCSDAVDGLSLLPAGHSLETILQQARPAPEAPKIRRLPPRLSIAAAASIALFLVSFLIIRSLDREMDGAGPLSLEQRPQTAEPQRLPGPPDSAEAVKQDKKDITQTMRTSSGKAAVTVNQEYAALREQDQGWFETSRTAGDMEDGYMADIQQYATDEVKESTVTILEQKNVTTGEDVKSEALSPVLAGLSQVDKDAEMVSEEKATGRKDKEDRAVADNRARYGNVVTRTVPSSAAKATDQSGLLSGMDAYNKGDFTGAAGEFRQTLKKNPSDANARYYYAMSLVYQEQYTQALEEFQKITLNDGSALYEAARWQMATVYRTTGDIPRARTILQAIIDGNGTYRRAAEEALDQLK